MTDRLTQSHGDSASAPGRQAAVPTITLIVAALNEELVIAETVGQIVEVVEGRFADYELLLVNDGSTDGTGQVMDRLAVANPRLRVFHHARNMGLGSSYRRGIVEARHEYVMLLCGDGGMPAASLPPIFDRIGTADIVVPYCENLKQIKTPGRYLLSRTYTLLLNTVFGLRLRYYNGLAVHRVELVRSLDNKSNGFGFQGEILVQLLRSGRSYVEVGVKGAEKTNRSSALRFKNVVSVSRTLGRLLRRTGFSRSERTLPGPWRLPSRDRSANGESGGAQAS
jgi:dolichol-phosphate mannosyltransferase